MKRKLLFVALCVVGAMSFKAYAQISWTSKTDLITNPSFESDNAISDLKGCGWATDRATGWTISPSTAGNSQVGVGNSSSTIQGIGDKFDPFAGNNYFYTRNNWQKNTTFTFSQTIIASDNNMPSGLYKLTCKAATYSSDAAFGTLTLGLQEGSKAAVVHDGIVLNVWNTWGVILFKEADDSNLAIQINFKPGYDGNSKHYALLLDDFQLEYISAADAYAASSSNSIDFSDIINNAGIYNHSTKGTMPRGWTSSKHTTGNGNYTEGEKGDTRFEGWSGGNLDIDYNQTITNLPAGTYTVTASAHERAEVGRTYVYAFTEGKDKATGLVNSKNDTDITTSELKVTNKTMKIGFESTANDWVTADDFRITFLGFDVDAVKTAYEESYGIATTAYNDATYNTVNGVEKTTLGNAIDTYTTETTQNYGWYVQAKGALDEARTAFTESKPYYDLLETEKTKAANLGMTAEDIAIAAAATKTGLAALQDLKVAEYTYVTTNYQYGVSLGEWTTEGYTADNSGQHFDGKDSSKYKEQENSWGTPKKGYAADSWSIKFYQSIELPAGEYVFKVAGRKASGSHTTMSLDVTKTSDNTSLGTVNDFPEGDTGLGINTSGATDFTIGEGHVYANSGAGRGWEWRYVRFSLSEPTEVKIAVNATADATSQWMSFCDYTLQTDNETNISLIAYNVALANAQTIIADDTYTNVIGSEKTELQAAIDADATLDKTDKTAIDVAKTTLDEKTIAFTGAKDAYNAYVAAKAVEYENKLPYASATKFAAIATAQSADNAISADDAKTKTNAILSAYRKYVESNALAEGVEGAEDKTSLIINPNMEVTYDNETHKFGAWQVIGQTNGNIQLLDNQSFTDGDGNSNYKYADIYKNDNNAGIQQIVNLEPGKYLLTVTARANTTAGAGFQVYAGSTVKEIQRIGSTGGTFDRGWNDTSVEFTVSEQNDVNIGVQSYNGKDLWWSATRFRLVKLEGEVKLATTVTAANKWGTFVAPFEVTLTGDDIKAYTIENDGYDANTKVLTLTEVNGTIEKNTPVILYYGGNTEGKLEASGVSDPVQNPTHGLLTGVYERTAAPNGSYILQRHTGDQTAAFYQVDTSVAQPYVPANKAYLDLTTQQGNAKILLSVDDEATAIAGFEALTSGNMEGIYTTSGAKVNSLQKGVNIIRTKDGKNVKVYVK